MLTTSPAAAAVYLAVFTVAVVIIAGVTLCAALLAYAVYARRARLFEAYPQLLGVYSQAWAALVKAEHGQVSPLAPGAEQQARARLVCAGIADRHVLRRADSFEVAFAGAWAARAVDHAAPLVVDSRMWEVERAFGDLVVAVRRELGARPPGSAEDFKPYPQHLAGLLEGATR